MKKVSVGLDLLVVYFKQIWNGVGWGGCQCPKCLWLKDYKLRQAHFLYKPYSYAMNVHNIRENENWDRSDVRKLE